jgi:NADH:ubiquinone oxidoreductase subunit C
MKSSLQSKKQTNLTTSFPTTYYLNVHIRLATLFYLSQLLDIFSYELPFMNQTTSIFKKNSSLTVVYNFHNLFSHTRILLFALQTPFRGGLKSITNLFPNANWLEREVAELFGFVFEGKVDTRNLMLQYGDSSAPFLKFFPSIGVKEVSYNSILDLLSNIKVTSQT